MSSRFDELSKALASGMPRRTVLRLFCASLLGSLAATWTRPSAQARPISPPVCSPPCRPGQQCIVLNGQAVCVGAGIVCSPPCRPGFVCILNGTGSKCVPGPCNPPCRPGEICMTLNGRHVCVSHRCNPPCKGDEICLSLNGRPFCVPRP